MGDPTVSFLIANIYAPCPNTREKTSFFEKVFDALSESSILYECENILVAGDFNLNFKEREMQNRRYAVQESNAAKVVENYYKGLGLKDIWSDRSTFTWRRPNTNVFSTIDRILYPESLLVATKTKVNWALSTSDHAAVIAGFRYKTVARSNKSKITRLDPSLLKCESLKLNFVHEVEVLLNEADEGWDPHMKLEYSKMCIRTVAERLQAERKKKVEEDQVNDDLNLAIRALEDSTSEAEKEELIEYIEELRDKKLILVEKKGERLAELGTKWYNEGEKSTRYFLNMLKRKAPDSFQALTDSQGNVIGNQEDIEREVVGFYKKLYEDYDKSKIKNIELNDDFFNLLECVTGSDEAIVAAPISVEELERTLLTCKDTAPGPDGIPYSFYRVLWRKIGTVIVNAWNHTLVNGNLCPSHKVSYLRLIPKVGKDLKNLTNWRPITLSNCDLKLITKTYANKMSSVVAGCIKERQTAYLKGHLINDNIRAIMSSINITNKEVNLDGLIVSLDAKKAFDSVEHSYIVKCLKKFGLARFVPIFEILYSDLKSDVIINGRIVPGYKILRGVKQGDALSCILFIMCMEPLLRNIEANPRIESIESDAIGPMPKAYAYADDVNVLTINTRGSLQEIFNEYNRLTEASGLELNADKTEIMRLNGRNQNETSYAIGYCGGNYVVKSTKEIKINGILFQQNEQLMIDANVNAVVRKVDAILRKWSARHLSLLGKIFIVKTFGISQVVYLLQSMVLNDDHFKKLNGIFYKFIWNRHYLAAKAPERIKREIVNKPVKLGGLGMLDLAVLDKGLKLKAFARLTVSNHPFLKKIYEKINLSYFFFPESNFELERVSYIGTQLLKEIRLGLIGDPRL